MKQFHLILPLAGLLLAGCATPPQEEVVHSVLLTRPVPASTQTAARFSGIVREASEISLGFKTPGQIKRIAVGEGDYVQPGQLIATLDDADYRLGVEALQVQYDQLRDEVARISQLYRGKSVSTNEYEKAQAGLKQLQVQLQVNQNKLAYTRLQAPVAGYVRSVNFEQAEMVDAGTPVVTLLDVNGMEVEVDVPSSIYERRNSLSRITCRALTASGESYPMKLLSLTPKADATQLYRMRLGFERQPGQALTAGLNMEAELLFTGGDSSRLFALPLRALFQAEGESYVWAVGPDSIIYKVGVQVEGGLDAEGRALVSGLKGDEALVRAGVHALREGEKVRPIPEHTETNVGGLL